MVDFSGNFVAFRRIDDIFSNDETATFISFLFYSSIFSATSSFSSFSLLCAYQSINCLFSFFFFIGIVRYSNDHDDDDDVEQ